MKSIIHVEDFKSENSEKNESGVLVKRKSEKAIHTYYKGAPETGDINSRNCFELAINMT